MKTRLASAALVVSLAIASPASAEDDARPCRLTVRLLTGGRYGSTVKLDGVAMTTSELGASRAIACGEHEVVVEALDRRPRTFDVTLSAGEDKVLDVAVGGGAYRSNGAGPNAGVFDTEDSEHTLDFSQRTVGLSLGGAGLGALAFGAVFGVVALSNAEDGNEEGSSAAKISTGFSIGGAIAVVAGAIILFTAPSSR